MKYVYPISAVACSCGKLVYLNRAGEICPHWNGETPCRGPLEGEPYDMTASQRFTWVMGKAQP